MKIEVFFLVNISSNFYQKIGKFLDFKKIFLTKFVKFSKKKKSQYCVQA
jgi:hypothetical protein